MHLAQKHYPKIACSIVWNSSHYGSKFFDPVHLFIATHYNMFNMYNMYNTQPAWLTILLASIYKNIYSNIVCNKTYNI
jgi:hypothetical protein